MIYCADCASYATFGDMSIDAHAHHWVPNTSTFGSRLALLRQHMGWNLKEAALTCGLPQGSWREWELKGRDPRGIQAIVEKIAERTGVDDYWLLTGKVNPTGGGGGDRSGLPTPADPDIGGGHTPNQRVRRAAQVIPLYDRNGWELQETAAA